MHFLNNCFPEWGPWNHASLTSISKKGAEIKVGIRKGFSMKGILAVRKSYELNECKRADDYKTPGSLGILLGNLVGWLWLKKQVYPKHMKFLHPYLISHPRPLGRSFSNFCWEEMKKLDLWTFKQGGCTVGYKNTIIQVKWKIADEHVFGKIKKTKGKGKIQLELFGTNVNTYPKPVKTFKENEYQIKVFASQSVYFCTDLNARKEKIKKTIRKKEKIPRSSGEIKDAIESILTVIAVNSLKPPDRAWLTSLMRRASVLLKGWNIYLWDNCFISLMATLHFSRLARGNLKALSSELTNHGFLPNQAHPLGRSEGITQLPVASYCALKTHSILKNSKELVSSILPSFLSNNNWWLKNRDPNKFHLLSYGSELEKKPAAVLKQNAQYESGMDNHPMFDDLSVDHNSGCIAMYPVGLNSIYALDCESLARLAHLEGKKKKAKNLSIRYRNMKFMINQYLWDGECYYNRLWSGEFDKNIYSTYLFPLIAGIPSKKNARILVDKVFRKCLTPFGLAPSSLSDPSFKEQITWRGRLLPPVQFLVSEGLRRYHFDKEASILARNCYHCFHKEWKDESHFHESYNGYTGDGDDVTITGEPGHPWAALFPYLSVQDFIDYEIWEGSNGLRIGRLKTLDAAITDVPIKGRKYGVSIKGTRMKLEMNRKLILETDYPCILRKCVINANEISFSQKGLQALRMKFHLSKGNYKIQLNDEIFDEVINQNEPLGLDLRKNKNNVKIEKL